MFLKSFKLQKMKNTKVFYRSVICMCIKYMKIQEKLNRLFFFVFAFLMFNTYVSRHIEICKYLLSTAEGRCFRYNQHTIFKIY